jgi:outer membrane protein OmpA-like peptidoglycan-associated protein
MEIKSALENLDPEYFRYDAKNKRHELNFDILYSSNSSKIPPSSKKQLLKAGRELEQAIKNASVINNNIKYLVIIEGMAAKFNTTSKSHINNQSSFINHTYNLSYNRAKEIYKFWNDNGINFDRNSVEVIIAGSGIFGSGRYTSQEEGKNKRILIQILPKTGEF